MAASAKSPRPARYGKAGDEIERKFLVPQRPAAFARAPHEAVEQGYVAIGEDGTEVRLRRQGRRHFLTVKATKTAKTAKVSDPSAAARPGTSRRETEVPITGRQFASLWPATAGRRVSKTRYRLKLGRYTAEVDVYHGPLRGLTTAEVEFPSARAAGAFEPPPWFGPDVTDDPRYKNQNLARHGKPGAAAKAG